ncbi:helix-turn-helix domain-containing protein [Shimia gijangensis]|nr:helix-turn-helix transcriptional regulator [Shimia gijangensis]
MTPAQSRAARGLVSMTQTELAKAASLGQSTVIDFEKERREVSENAKEAIRTALETAGVEFIAENGGGAGVRLRK